MTQAPTFRRALRHALGRASTPPWAVAPPAIAGYSVARRVLANLFGVQLPRRQPPIQPFIRRQADVDGILRELWELVGLDAVKETIGSMVDEARAGVPGASPRHQLFLGPPGVGKATVAGLLGGVYAGLGMLDSGHLIACRPLHLTGRDAVDTETRVSVMVEQALGGVLLIEQAEGLTREVVGELLKHLLQRRGEFVLVCTISSGGMPEALAAGPDFRFRAEFAEPIEFAPLTDRQLVSLFQKFAERDLYILDEELRAELVARFSRMRAEPGFSYATTVRALFDQTVARQAIRLAGTNVTASSVARLTVGDLPESALGRTMDHSEHDRGNG